VPVRQVEVSLEEPVLDSRQNLPTIQKWKGENMIRVHSLRATIKEILQVIKVRDLVKIGIVGESGTGKTTLAGTIQHLLHKMSDIPFAVRVFGEEEFLHIKETLAALEPVNYIMYFHDLSFLQDKRALEEVKAAITKIRHLKADVKIILIYDYHYTLGLDKFLRQADFRYFTSVGSSEDDNMIKIVGSKFSRRVKEFQDKYVEMSSKHKCSFMIGKNKFFTYNYMNPFVVVLFWNNQRLRYTIFPKRQWIDPICSICALANDKLLHSSISLEKFKEESEIKFTRHVFMSAVKLKSFIQGINVYSKPIVAALRYIDRALEKKDISLEELLASYGFETKQTKLRHKLDGVLADKEKDG
jgi:energy-coupling factor transporter ATP-binding protein EcfA2